MKTTHHMGVDDGKPPWRMLAFVCLAVFLCGCARELAGPGVVPDKPSAGDSIAAIGRTFVTVGCIALGIAVLARVATFIVAALKPFAGVIDDCIILAGSSIAFGSALVWVGVHSWVLWVVCLACLAVWLTYRRRSIIALWRKIVKGTK